MDRIRNIKDLASLAGVSAGTVSRALADSELISRRTRERIQALADEHGFRPNVLARNLRIQRTGAIGVVVHARATGRNLIADPLFVTMLGLLADALTERGYDLLLSRARLADNFRLEHFIRSGRTDGTIVLGHADQWDEIEVAAERSRSLVVWGGYQKGQRHCSIGSDLRQGGNLAAGHLVDRGCRRFAFIGDTNQLEVAFRLEGFRKRLAAEGLADVLTVVATPEEFLATFPAEGGHSNGRPDGVFASDDGVAADCLARFAKVGVRVPTDVKLIGYGGLALGEQVMPALSTISYDHEQSARVVVDLLLRRIAGEETDSVLIEPRLVVRASTG
jgi:DNA-binding LacI/PurR family transcriptional regulator